MLNTATIKSLNLQRLFLLDSQSLVQPEVIFRLDELSDDPQFEYEPGKALEFFESLSQIVKNYNNQVSENEKAYFELTRILWKLSWKSLPAMPLNARQNILNDNLIPTFMGGIDVKKYLEKILAPYEVAIGPEKDLRRQWIYSLETNKEILGKKTISLEGGSSEPQTIQNWLRLYISTQGRGREDNFKRINFFNTERNVNSLGKEEKKVLEEICSLYIWLLTPPPEPKVVPDEEFNTKSYMFSGKFTAKPSSVDLDLDESSKIKPQIKTLSPVKKIDINEILSKGSGARLGAAEQVTSDKLKVTSAEHEQKKPVVMEPKVVLPAVPVKKVESENADRSNGTHRIDRTNETNKTNTTEDLNQIRLDIEKKKQMAQAEIDKRLESLKNRKANN